MDFVIDHWAAIVLGTAFAWAVVASATGFAVGAALHAQEVRKARGETTEAEGRKRKADQDIHDVRRVLYPYYNEGIDGSLYFHSQDEIKKGQDFRGRFAERIAASMDQDLSIWRQMFEKTVAKGPGDKFDSYIASLRYLHREAAEHQAKINRAWNVVGLFCPHKPDQWGYPYPSDELTNRIGKSPDLGKLAPEDWENFSDAFRNVSQELSDRIAAARSAVKDAHADRIAARVVARLQKQ
jgi:hypothetical protein